MSVIIDIARQEVGTTENPPDSNKTKYGEWANLNGVAWCALFVSWCYEHAGTPLPKIGFNFHGFAGCQTGYAYFKEHGWIIPAEEAKAGDIVLFDWNGDKRYDHTGLFSMWLENGYFETIEGNTAIGNDSNGGKVMARKRHKSFAIFIRPKL